MKTFLFTIFFSAIMFAQTKIGSNELFFYQDGSGSTSFTYNLRPIVNKVWNNLGDQMTVDHYGNSVFYPLPLTLSGYYGGVSYLNGMDYILSYSGEQWPLFGNSLYEVTCKINGVEQAYFYLDTRDCNYPNSSYNDFTIKYIHNKGKDKKFYIAEGKGVHFNSSKFKEVTDNVKSLWQVEPISGPIVDCFDEYWNNCLGLGHVSLGYLFKYLCVRLIWGPHPTFPTTHYKIYQSIPNTTKYSLIATVNNAIFEYVDEEIE